MRDEIFNAMFEEAFPTNPIPFARALAEYITANGTDSIKRDLAKRLLWVLMVHAYGQLAVIDLMEEYTRLHQNSL